MLSNILSIFKKKKEVEVIPTYEITEGEIVGCSVSYDKYLHEKIKGAEFVDVLLIEFEDNRYGSDMVVKGTRCVMNNGITFSFTCTPIATISNAERNLNFYGTWLE